MSNLSTNYIKRDNKIDFFKGIAMLMIIFVHSTQKFPGINNVIRQVSRCGQLGTQMFLVLASYNAFSHLTKERECKNMV